MFSMTIPGRVGYQCSNFYRHLVKKGEIKDPDYFVDSKGQVHCKYGKGCRTRKNRDHEGDEEFEKKLRKKKKRKDSDDEENIYASSASNEDEEEDSKVYTEYKSARLANPLPGFKDPITMEQIEKPAISPYGHVMGYETWTRILSQEPRNVCPFTKQTLHRKDLVKLNFDNIEQYQDKIKNNH
jgi:hypothetical protein